MCVERVEQGTQDTTICINCKFIADRLVALLRVIFSFPVIDATWELSSGDAFALFWIKFVFVISFLLWLFKH